MDLLEAMAERHAVRRYIDKPIEPEKAGILEEKIKQINRESGLHLQLIQKEPKAFAGGLFHYGSFAGVTSYFALIGPKGEEEKIGHEGEKLVLLATTLGLNTCWVALTYKKVKAVMEIAEGEKLYLVIALGYGESQGTPHKSKKIEEVSNWKTGDPEWFKKGVEAALLAPTAVNQQKFFFQYDGDNKVKASTKNSFYVDEDLGIAKLHFEIGAGSENFVFE